MLRKAQVLISKSQTWVFGAQVTVDIYQSWLEKADAEVQTGLNEMFRDCGVGGSAPKGPRTVLGTKYH